MSEINAYQAYKEVIQAGINTSYPTMVKRLLEEGIASQRVREIQVDAEKLSLWISKQQEEAPDGGPGTE